MKIGIFGGSFNPPHNTHLKIVNNLLTNKLLDKVIFVPAGIKYEYKNNLISNNDRFNMLKLMTKDNESIEVSDYEFTNEVTYTYQTLDYFKGKYKNDIIYFICGADNLDYIDKWKNGEYILSNYPIIVFNRKNYNIKRYNNANIIVSDMELSDISSTNIRENIKNNIYNDICDEVKEYIINNNLYKGE